MKYYDFTMSHSYFNFQIILYLFQSMVFFQELREVDSQISIGKTWLLPSCIAKTQNDNAKLNCSYKEESSTKTSSVAFYYENDRTTSSSNRQSYRYPSGSQDQVDSRIDEFCKSRKCTHTAELGTKSGWIELNMHSLQPGDTGNIYCQVLVIRDHPVYLKSPRINLYVDGKALHVRFTETMYQSIANGSGSVSFQYESCNGIPVKNITLKVDNKELAAVKFKSNANNEYNSSFEYLGICKERCEGKIESFHPSAYNGSVNISFNNVPASLHGKMEAYLFTEDGSTSVNFTHFVVFVEIDKADCTLISIDTCQCYSVILQKSEILEPDSNTTIPCTDIITIDYNGTQGCAIQSTKGKGKYQFVGTYVDRNGDTQTKVLGECDLDVKSMWLEITIAISTMFVLIFVFIGYRYKTDPMFRRDLQRCKCSKQCMLENRRHMYDRLSKSRSNVLKSKIRLSEKGSRARSVRSSVHSLKINKSKVKRVPKGSKTKVKKTKTQRKSTSKVTV